MTYVGIPFGKFVDLSTFCGQRNLLEMGSQTQPRERERVLKKGGSRLVYDKKDA